jgi:Mrp family chromosome partitioning ATPase
MAKEGHILMSRDDHDDRPKPGQGARPGHVSVFRPGQPLPGDSVTLDQRTGREIFLAPMALAPFNPARVWESITEVPANPDLWARNGLFADTGQGDKTQGTVTRTFDMLRTRLLQVLAKQGWTRIAVTSPTHGCGKSFVAANLALSLARLPSCRTVLMDLELRDPKLASLFGIRDAPPLIEYLMGEQPLEGHFRRIGRNLALALNGDPVARASELLQDPEFPNAMSTLRDLLQPDVVLIDTPPALSSDDVLSLAEQVDAVLLVVDGTVTSPEDVRACERLFDGRLPLLGTVLNRAQDRGLDRYTYGQRG